MEKSKPLLEITKELHALELAVIDSGGEFSDEIENQINPLVIAKEKKVDAYSAMITRLEGLEEEFKKKAESFLQVSKTAKNLRESLKNNIKLAMSHLDSTVLEGALYTFKLSKAKSKLVIVSEASIPQIYKKKIITEELDKDLLRSDLESGKTIPGAILEPSTSLRTTVSKGF